MMTPVEIDALCDDYIERTAPFQCPPDTHGFIREALHAILRPLERRELPRRWRDTKVTVPCDGDNVLGYWCPSAPGGNFDCDVVHYYAGMWHEPDDDEDDYRAPDFWMPLPTAPACTAAPDMAAPHKEKS